MDETAVATQVRPEAERECQQPRAWNVVLLDDDDHTYDYVIRMVREIFGYDERKALGIARSVDTHKRVVCLTTHKEHAELKVEQIHSFGPDKLLARSVGAMSAIIEPADFDGDDDEERDGGGA